jgi:hypothetical protein
VQGGTLRRSSVSGNLTYNDPAFPGVTVANLFSDTSRQIDLSKSALGGVQFGWNWQLGDGSGHYNPNPSEGPWGEDYPPSTAVHCRVHRSDSGRAVGGVRHP